MIAGLHIKQSPIQTKTMPCCVCEKPIYLSGYNVDVQDNRVKVQAHNKAIALECLAELISKYGSYVVKNSKQLTQAQKEELENLEVSNVEYLEELSRMTPIAQKNPRLGYMMGWLGQVAKLDIPETPEGLTKQFVKDMNELSGALG